MRKQDIIVTTPLKSIIYAAGTHPGSSDKVWIDLSDYYYYDSHWHPTYVLSEPQDGYVIVLQAHSHPDTAGAKDKEQASALDALGYTIEDYEALKNLNEKYSHWPLSAEQREAKEEELAELKELPKGWTGKAIRTGELRMLWADYDSQLNAKIAARAKAREEEQAKNDAKKAEVADLIDQLIELGIVNEEERQGRVNQSRFGSFYFDFEQVKKLIELAVTGA